MPRSHKLAGALALALGCTGAAQAQEFTGFYVFGDSLSDSGNIAQAQGLPAGFSFTTNTDPVAAEIIAAAFGLLAQADMLEWGDAGASIVEISHRGPEFMEVATRAEADLRTLLGVPDDLPRLLQSIKKNIKPGRHRCSPASMKKACSGEEPDPSHRSRPPWP